MTRIGLKARLAAAGAVALALAACDDRGGRVDAPEPASLAELSTADALPYAEPARVDYQAPAQGYAWAERAYGLQHAVYDTPPDYGFDYGGVEPLAWETEDDWVMYAEPWDDGYRYYYYEPGADYPYFVRDDDYGYGYGHGGVLVAVFDAGGRYLPVDIVYRVAPTAGRYYARGHDLRSASRRARRIQVTDQVWASRAPQVIRTADPWLRAARDDRQWRAWRDKDQDRELRRFEPEAARRAVKTRQWREQDDRREATGVRANQDQWRRDVGGRPQQAERQRVQADRPWAGEARRREEVQRVQQDQRRQGERDQAQRQRQAERQQVEQHQRAQQQAQQRQRAEQRRQLGERQQAEQRRREYAGQQRQQVERAQQQAQQQQRQRAEQQRQHAERQQVDQQRRQQADRQQAEQRQRQAHEQRQQMAQQRQQQASQQRHQPQRQPQAQAPSAQQHGQPAAARDQGGGGQDHGKGRGRDRKD